MSDLDQLSVPEWLIPDLIYEQQIGILYAPHGSFKSFIALDIASRIAHGMDWCGEILLKQNTVYVAGEGGAMMKRRRLAWFKYHKLQPADDGLWVIPQAINLLDTNQIIELIEWIKENVGECALVVLDTLSTCMAGVPETDAASMTAAIEGAKAIAARLKCAVLIVAHPGKDISRGVRGHSSAEANVDMICEIERAKTGKGERLFNATGVIRKQKDAEDGIMFKFDVHKIMLGTTDRRGYEISSLVAEPLVATHTAGTHDKKLASDRVNIACAIKEAECPISMTKVALRLETAFGRRSTALERIKVALPLDAKFTVELNDDIVELTRAEAGISIFRPSVQ